MKKLYSLLICSLIARLSSLHAEELPAGTQQEIVSVYPDEIPPTYNGQLNASSLERSFFYTSYGRYYASEDIDGLDFGLGYRKIYGTVGGDFILGCTWVNYSGIIPFCQGSCLVYLQEGNSPYCGLGLSVVCVPGWWQPFMNAPLILGYQTSTESRPILITQVQFSLVSVPGGTASVGVGF